MSVTTVKKTPDLSKKIDRIERFLKLVCSQEWNKFIKMESYTRLIKKNKAKKQGDEKDDKKLEPLVKEMETYVNDTFEELADSYQRMDEIIPNVKEGFKQLLIECYTSQTDPHEYFMKMFEEINKEVMEELGNSIQNEVKSVLVQKPVGTNDEKEIQRIKERFTEHQKVIKAIDAIQAKEKKEDTNKKQDNLQEDVIGMPKKKNKKDKKDDPDTGSLGLPKEKKKK